MGSHHSCLQASPEGNSCYAVCIDVPALGHPLPVSCMLPCISIIISNCAIRWTYSALVLYVNIPQKMVSISITNFCFNQRHGCARLAPGQAGGCARKLLPDHYPTTLVRSSSNRLCCSNKTCNYINRNILQRHQSKSVTAKRSQAAHWISNRWTDGPWFSTGLNRASVCASNRDENSHCTFGVIWWKQPLGFLQKPLSLF